MTMTIILIIIHDSHANNCQEKSYGFPPPLPSPPQNTAM